MAVWSVEYTFIDAYGRGTTRSYKFNAVDFTAALTALGAFTTDLAAVTGAEVVKYRVTSEVSVSDAVTPLANKDAGITFSALLANGKKASLKIPAPIATQLNADGSVILADVDVAAFLDHWESGEFLLSDGEVVTSFLKGTLDE